MILNLNLIFFFFFVSNQYVSAFYGVNSHDFFKDPLYQEARKLKFDLIYGDKGFNCMKDKKGKVIKQDFIDMETDPPLYARNWFDHTTDHGRVLVRVHPDQIGGWNTALKAVGFNIAPSLVFVKRRCDAHHRKDNWSETTHAA